MIDSFSQLINSRFRINVIDIFDDEYREKSIDHWLQLTEEKCVILIESLPWLLLRTSEGELCRLLHRWSRKIDLLQECLMMNFTLDLESHVVMAVIPINCIDEESSFFKNLVLLSYITLRLRTSIQSEIIEGRLEQRSKTSVDTIKSVITSESTFFLMKKYLICG